MQATHKIANNLLKDILHILLQYVRDSKFGAAMSKHMADRLLLLADKLVVMYNTRKDIIDNSNQQNNGNVAQ